MTKPSKQKSIRGLDMLRAAGIKRPWSEKLQDLGKILEEFRNKSAELWFRWISWALYLGALQYIYLKSAHPLPNVLLWLSTFLIGIHFHAFFSKCEDRHLSFIRWNCLRNLISVIITVLLTFIFYGVSINLADLASQNR